MTAARPARLPAGTPRTGSPGRTGRGLAPRRWRRVLIALSAMAGIGVAAALAAIALGAWRPGPAGQRQASAPPASAPLSRASAPPPARPPVGALGRYRVLRTSVLLDDRARRRLLPTLIWFPAMPVSQVASGQSAAGPFPLVLFAPGYRQCRSSYSVLLRAWASAGYVVAAVEFPLTGCHAVAPNEADVSNQPADLRYAVGALLAISARPAGPLSGLVDPASIAVAGHSDGGDDAAVVAADTCCRDRRIAAAVILAGAPWPPLGGHYFPAGSPPVLFVQGDADTWNPPPASQQLYAADRSGIRYYLDLIGADHFTPYEGRGAPEPLVARVTLDFLNRYLAGERRAGAALAADARVRGVAELAAGGRLPR